jgi:hypothetical protein
MNNSLPQKITTAGGIFILLSGILNTILGVQIGAMLYYPYPGGKMGHVGIFAGLGAILIGAVIIYTTPRLYNHKNKPMRILGSILVMVLGHLGAVLGALYLGTVGVFLCYLGGVWFLIGILRS